MWKQYVTILAIALLFRVTWVVVVPVIPVSDAGRYDTFARSLATGDGYVNDAGPTAYWPVGPSFLFSLLYRVLGWEHAGRYLPIAMLNVALGTATVALTMTLARRWFSRDAALGAGLLLALWPSQIEFSTVLASETPFIFLMLAALTIWCAKRPQVWLRGALAGVALAAACYMRPTALLLPAVFGLSRLVSHPRDRFATLGGTAAMAGVVIALVLPWALRNQRVFGEFVPISTNGGVNLWMGNNPETTGFYQAFPGDGFTNEADRDRQARDQAIEYISAHPLAFLGRSVVKFIRLHERETIGVHWNIEGLQRRFSPAAISAIKWAGNLYWWAMLLLAIVGIVRLVLNRRFTAWIALPPIVIWVYFAVVHAVTVIQDRYHFAFIPCIAILAGAALGQWLRSENVPDTPQAKCACVWD